MTTTVVATVVAAPVLALWVAYRHAPSTGEGHGGSVTTSEADGPSGNGASPYDHYENAGNARTQHTPFADDSSSPDVSVEVISPDAGNKKAGDGSCGPRRPHRRGPRVRWPYLDHPDQRRRPPTLLVGHQKRPVALPQQLVGRPVAGRLDHGPGVCGPPRRTVGRLVGPGRHRPVGRRRLDPRVRPGRRKPPPRARPRSPRPRRPGPVGRSDHRTGPFGPPDPHSDTDLVGPGAQPHPVRPGLPDDITAVDPGPAVTVVTGRPYRAMRPPPYRGSAGCGAIGSSAATRSSHSSTRRSYAGAPISSTSSGRYVI